MSPPVPIDAHAGIWRADALARPIGTVLATGHATLDTQLPGGGWPVGALVEILQAHSGQNEWRLLLPALVRSGTGPVVLVGAPHMPFGPGLSAQGLAPERLLWVRAAEPAARMWVGEQALRCKQVCAVLAWLPQARADQLRRLQMAAGEHGKLLFVMRPARVQAESSPAVLRLLVRLQAQTDGIEVEILKRRGPPAAQPVQMPARAARLAALLARGHLSGRGQAGPAWPVEDGRLGGQPDGAALSIVAARMGGDVLARTAAAA
ncbi:MAG: translesion DNA synthesis-associated protein ImuA [Betaproteobacteria bacterium]